MYYIDFSSIYDDYAHDMNRLMHNIHKLIKHYDTSIAVALPTKKHFLYNLNTIRLFSNDKSTLQDIQTQLTSDSIISIIHEVNNTAIVEYVEYKQYKIPTIKTDRKDGAPCRQRRMRYANENLPFFNMQSSSGAKWRMYVETIMHDTNSIGIVTKTNGYGLSTTNNQIILPLIYL
jgi:hypothetical protein